MAQFRLIEVPTDNFCIWLDLKRSDGTFTTIGMIKQVPEGFKAIGALAEETFFEYKEAKKYIVSQFNGY